MFIFWNDGIFVSLIIHYMVYSVISVLLLWMDYRSFRGDFGKCLPNHFCNYYHRLINTKYLIPSDQKTHKIVIATSVFPTLHSNFFIYLQNIPTNNKKWKLILSRLFKLNGFDFMVSSRDVQTRTSFNNFDLSHFMTLRLMSVDEVCLNIVYNLHVVKLLG